MPVALLASALLVLAADAGAQAPGPPAVGADWRPLDPASTLVIDTTKGRVVVELRPEIAPGHVARLKALTRQGYYTGSRFYRVIKGFMAQTGDDGRKQFRSALPNLKAEFTFAPSPGAPYVSFGASPDGELGFIGSMPVVTPPGGRGHAAFCPGIASLAHGADPDTANSQAFFMRGRGGPTIEAHFTAWGRVVQGQEVIEAIQDGEPPPMPDKIIRLRVMADMPAADRPRLEVMDTRGPAFAALVAEAMKAKAPYFNLCDVTVPTQPG